MNKVVVNFYGGPGSGKTTAAAHLFTILKQKSIDTEIVSEFAKDIVLERNYGALEHQWYVLAHQAYRVMCAYRAMQVTIVDSPILLGPIYDRDNSKALNDLCLEHHHRYNNLNVLVPRIPSYNHSLNGRVHSLTESIAIDNKIVNYLKSNNIEYIDLRDLEHPPIETLSRLVLSEIESD
jgi:predicted ATPase